MSILTSAWKYIKAKFSKKEYYPLWVFLHIHTNLKICIDGLPMVHVLWLLLGALNCYAIKMLMAWPKKKFMVWLVFKALAALFGVGKGAVPNLWLFPLSNITYFLICLGRWFSEILDIDIFEKAECELRWRKDISWLYLGAISLYRTEHEDQISFLWSFFGINRSESVEGIDTLMEVPSWFSEL